MPFYCYNKEGFCTNCIDCDNCDVFVHGRGGKEVPSNADRIRAMSDEELTDAWIRDNTICHRCAYWSECECDEFVTNEKCREGILEWHKQPADMRGEEDG